MVLIHINHTSKTCALRCIKMNLVNSLNRDNLAVVLCMIAKINDVVQNTVCFTCHLHIVTCMHFFCNQGQVTLHRKISIAVLFLLWVQRAYTVYMLKELTIDYLIYCLKLSGILFSFGMYGIDFLTLFHIIYVQYSPFSLLPWLQSDSGDRAYKDPSTVEVCHNKWKPILTFYYLTFSFVSNFDRFWHTTFVAHLNFDFDCQNKSSEIEIWKCQNLSKFSFLLIHFTSRLIFNNFQLTHNVHFFYHNSVW